MYHIRSTLETPTRARLYESSLVIHATLALNIFFIRKEKKTLFFVSLTLQFFHAINLLEGINVSKKK